MIGAEFLISPDGVHIGTSLGTKILAQVRPTGQRDRLVWGTPQLHTLGQWRSCAFGVPIHLRTVRVEGQDMAGQVVGYAREQRRAALKPWVGCQTAASAVADGLLWNSSLLPSDIAQTGVASSRAIRSASSVISAAAER